MEGIEPKRDFAVSCFVPFFGGLTSTPLTRTLQEALPEKVYVWNLREDDGAATWSTTRSGCVSRGSPSSEP